PGPTAEDVLFQYYTLTGFPMMPPLFALGYHHAHRGYGKMDELLNVSAAFLQAQIPVDTLGIGLHYMRGKRIFTWNLTRFSNPVRLQDELWRHGGRFMVLSTVPYVRVDPRFSLYIEGKRHEYFVRTHAESEEIFIGFSESGANVWIDFLDSRARHWYGGLMKYKRFLGSTNHTFFHWRKMSPFCRVDCGERFRWTWGTVGPFRMKLFITCMACCTPWLLTVANCDEHNSTAGHFSLHSPTLLEHSVTQRCVWGTTRLPGSICVPA
ncbi:glycosyl hydrolase-like protein, partial [Trypanosoma cruzi]